MSTISSDITEKYSNRVEKLREDFAPTLGAPRQVFESVRQALAKQHYQYPLRPLLISGWFGVRSPAEIEIKNRSEKVIKTGDQAQLISDGKLNIPGIAFLAAHLQQKNNVQNLYVCESTVAFQEKLEEISKMSGNYRAALIVPIDLGKKQTCKMTIGIEKEGSTLKIVVLTPYLKPSEKDPNAITSTIALATPDQIEELFKNDDDEETDDDVRILPDTTYVEALLWSLYQTPLNWDQTQVYMSFTSRLESRTGSDSIALRDGVAFLKDPSFFGSLETQNHSLKDKNIKTIQKLPPAFMKATESMNDLRKYLRENPAASPQLGKNKYIHVGILQNSNHYAAIKSFKDRLFVIKALETQNMPKIKEIISQSLLRSKKDESAKTILENYVIYFR